MRKEFSKARGGEQPEWDKVRKPQGLRLSTKMESVKTTVGGKMSLILQRCAGSSEVVTFGANW